MSHEPKSEAVLALHRFGLGPRPGSLSAIASDPRGAMLADIARRDAGRIADGSLMRSDAAVRADFEYRAARREARRATAKAEQENAAAGPQRGGASDTRSMAGRGSITQSKEPAEREPERRVRVEIYLQESEARAEAALAAEIGVAERLVWFWSNHFCASGKKGTVRAIVGSFEREAIRPHVLGRFVDMLLAAETHPAMLVYLDNAKSFGPNSRFGRNRSRGLNENLAREILELHTLGVRSVYNQAEPPDHARQDLSRHRFRAGPCCIDRHC
jgi:uncharacterized protein (DUF1800 family)